MNVYQLCIWYYPRCAEKQLDWWCFLEISCHHIENSCLSCSSSNFFFLDCLDYPLWFAPALCSYAVVVETKGQSPTLRKLSLELFFDLTDSFKWWLNSFPKWFPPLVSNHSTLFFSMFSASSREYTLERMLHFWWYEIGLLVRPSKQMVCSRRLRISSRNKGGVTDFFR